MLLNNVLSMRDAETNKDALFNRTYTISYKKNQELYMKWEKTIPKETRDIWRGDTHMTMRNEAVPQYQVGVEAGNFLLSEYCHLPADLRAVTDLAFQGFLFSALNDLDFGSLCKDKGLDVSALTLEQKLDVELDHEALYARLLTQLGHA